MGKHEKLVQKILSGRQDNSFGFSDITKLLMALGFAERVYEIIIYWSETDNAYIAEVPELAGCMADWHSYNEVMQNAQSVILDWIETAAMLDREIPEPKGKLLSA
jgi:predicted RNase H-like HicB family nuclease